MTYIAPSPDVTRYTDLTVYDADPSTLVQRAVLNALQYLPGLQVVEGDTAMVVWEGMALIISELVYAVNRLPGATVETLLGLFNLPRLQGTPPTTSVTFTVETTNGYTVPAGTGFQVSTPRGPVSFTTDKPLAIASGSTIGTVTATGTSNTDQANGVASGTQVTVTQPLFVVTSAVLASVVTAGALPESSSAWLSRATTALQSLNSTLVLPAHFQAYALANGAYRAYVEDNYDASIPATAAGVVSLAVLGQGGATLSAPAKSAMQVAMNAQAVANLLVRVVDPSVTTVNVTVTVMATAGTDSTALQTAVAAAIRGYLSPDAWQWGNVVRVYKLVNVIENVPGVDYIVGNLTAPSADVTLSGFGPIAEAGTVTVTVDTP